MRRFVEHLFNKEKREKAMTGNASGVKKTYCRICMVNCGLEVHVEEGRIARVKGDFEHPLTQGYTCPKGRASGEQYHQAGALTEPLMRKNGELVPVSWDEALDDIAGKLRAVIDEHGKHAIGIYFGSGLGIDAAGYGMEEALWAALDHGPKFSPLSIDGTAKVLMAGAMAKTYAINPKTDYDNVSMLIYVGTNPMVSHGHNTGMFNPAKWIRDAAARGDVWTIDPVATETAKFSTRHLAPHPSTDHAVLAWLLREIIEGGPLDPQQPVDGLDALRPALDGFTLDKAAAISGLPEQDLLDLLAAVRRHGPTVVETGTGVTMGAPANVTQWLAWSIMVLTGAMNRKGGTFLHPGFIWPFEQIELPLLESALTPGPKSRPDVRGVCGDWPCGVLPDEIDAGNIRALFNFGGSLMRSFPDTARLERSLKSLGLNVVTEINANETTALSTHVLPTKASFERPEFTRWDTLNWKLNMQYSPALMAPMGKRRSAWWVLSQIMRRADLPVANHVPVDDSDPGADDFMLAQIMPMGRCSFEDLKQQRYVEVPLEFPAQWVNRHFERIGGWKLAPAEIVAQWQAIRAADEAAIGKPRPLVFTARRQRRKLNAQLDFLNAPAELLIHPETAADHGVAHGQQVRVWNKAGEIVLPARVDPGMVRGAVSIPHGHVHANVNLLTSTADIDPLGGMALYSGVPVEIAGVT